MKTKFIKAWMSTWLMALATVLPCSGQQLSGSFKPGQMWLDDQARAINAHGGGILYHGGIYYWYGEYKQGTTTLPAWATWECYRTDVVGISCYSSSDLLNWHFEGIVLAAEPTDTLHDLHPSQVVERPKVIYNESTGQFVMWMHIDSADYTKAACGVAVSTSPTGPFRYLGSFRPLGHMSRDQTLFVDDNGCAYQICSSDDNATLHIHPLSVDYLTPTLACIHIFVGQYREAPAVFKHDGKYYLLTSGCSGWDPNVADVAVADSMEGPWTSLGNPCVGANAEKTFNAQSTFVLPVAGRPGTFVAMFDRWVKTDLPSSRYVWLPLTFRDGCPQIRWHDMWNLTDFR